MASPDKGPRIPQAERPWDCNPIALLCRQDHLLRFYLTEWRFDLRRLSGHAFAACHECAPPSYMMIVLAKVDGLAVATVYPIGKESYDEWERGEEPSPPTSELLYRLKDPQGRSHNPYWRPATTRRTG
jgi:hypothetical protein